MTGPSTPGQEGPTYAPPPLPEGWIAQWDGMSRKYYFVQLSTGASQWETPTHPAATGPTPQATPQEGLEHPYGTPGQGHVGYDENAGQGEDGERGIGQFAMNQLLGGNKKQNQGGLGQLSGLATQFLGGGHSNQQPNHSNSGAAGIVGALAGNLLGGGKKPQQQNYSGAQNNHQQSGGGGLMGSLGGIFGGHQNSQQGGNFGYSQQHNQQGGYTGSAPPTSYQPSGASNPQYNAPPQQHSYQSPPPAQSYGSQQTTYGAPPNQQSTYGASPNQQQPVYGTHPGQQQPIYGGQQAPYSGPTAQQSPYGGIQHQDSYGGGAPPQASYPPPGGYPQGGATYGQQPPNSGNLQQPQHQHFQGLHNAEHSGGLYGNAGGAPNVPTNTHPHHGQHHGQHQGW